jgi:hypothetical protein
MVILKDKKTLLKLFTLYFFAFILAKLFEVRYDGVGLSYFFWQLENTIF